MSLAKLRKIGEDGVAFRSHLDGSAHLLTPERSIEIQHLLGADVTMALDECTPYPSPREAVEASMELSMRWAERSRRAFADRPGHGIFGIVQGGVHPDIRQRSAARLIEIGFDGYAVGGLAIGEGQATTSSSSSRRRAGIAGGPAALFDGGRQARRPGRRGHARIDMLDCVLPTRSGRTAQAFTRRGPLNFEMRAIPTTRGRSTRVPLPTCTRHSRAYRPSVPRSEILGAML